MNIECIGQGAQLGKFATIFNRLSPVVHLCADDTHIIEPPRGKTNNVVSEQVRHKPACTSTEKS